MTNLLFPSCPVGNSSIPRSYLYVNGKMVKKAHLP
jgi:hypothetical protein